MTHHFRIKTLACCIGAALGSLAAGAQADSSVGVDTLIGNTLNPGVLRTVPARDPDGVDALKNQRSPTGFLYPSPILPPDAKSGAGWQTSGQAELGGTLVTGDTDNATFLKYKDLNDGLYLNNFQFQARDAGSGQFFEMYGGGLGYRDQFFVAKGGRYNDWKAKFFYNETPHVFTTTYRSLWNKTDDDYMRLGALTPGGLNNAANTWTAISGRRAADTSLPPLGGVLGATGYSELSIQRRKGGLDVEKFITSQWRLYGGYNLEKREGSRPFGAVFGGGGGGGNVEIPEVIDYDTHEMLAGVRFDDGQNNLNLQFKASLFRNNADTMTFENPLFVTAQNGFNPNLFTTGTFDLYPDNDYYNLRAEYARSMPEFYKSRFTAVASFSSMRQDDDLVAPTSLSLAGGAINGISAANVWNTTDALSRKSADAQIDTMLIDLGLVMNPIENLDVKGKIRYYETDNKTEYFSCNPLTNQWGRLINDGSGGSFVNTPAYLNANCSLAAVQGLGVVPNAANIKIRNSPYEYSQINYTLSGDYRLGRASSVYATYEREEFDREWRERDETWENRFELGYTNRGLSFGSVRLSADYGSRRGDDYRVDEGSSRSGIMGPMPTAGALGGYIYALDGLRKYDIADRDRLTLNGRLNFMATEDLDLGLAVQYSDIEYPDSDFGRSDHQKLTSFNLDATYQPNSRLNLYGFYSYMTGHLEQSNLSATAIPGATATCNLGAVFNGMTINTGNFLDICGNPSPTGPLLYSQRAWQMESDERNHTFGMGFKYDFGKVRLDVGYTYVTGVTEIDYKYNAAAMNFNPAVAELAGSGMPDLKMTQHFLDFNLIVPINKSVAVRALYRYEAGKIDDWHYNGVDANPMPTNNTLYLDSGPEDYSTNLFGLFVQVNF